MPDRDPNVRIAIEHSIKILSRWTVALYLAVGSVLGLGILVNRSNTTNAQEEAARTHTALCTFVDDLQGRIDGTVKYLKRHPGPEPIPGISRYDLRQTLENQRKTFRSLDGLRCE